MKNVTDHLCYMSFLENIKNVTYTSVVVVKFATALGMVLR